MSSAVIFAVGILVFLITVYGTVVTGGLMLTNRQLDQQPEIAPPDHPAGRGEDPATSPHPLVPGDY